MLIEEQIKKVQIICPICKSKEIVNLPLKIINTSAHLSTVSIPKGKVCNHHFQIFIDKAFNIRGYQKVDFELEMNKNLLIDSKNAFMNGLELYKKNPKRNIPKKTAKFCSSEEQTDRIIRSIYKEFWEIIDDDNEMFRKYILKDKNRREKLSQLIRLNDHKSGYPNILQKTN